MFDKELVAEILRQIYHATLIVQKRAVLIQSANDFIDTEDGSQKLDSICMQLISIGESLKNLDKITHSEFLIQYPEIDWKNIKKMRDIIAHHYFDIDAEVVYSVCKQHIPSNLSNADGTWYRERLNSINVFFLLHCTKARRIDYGTESGCIGSIAQSRTLCKSSS